jgi:hypothetical protein
MWTIAHNIIAAFGQLPFGETVTRCVELLRRWRCQRPVDHSL